MKEKGEEANRDDYTEKMPIGGTLGILAYGYSAVMEWRKTRYYHSVEKVTQQQNEQSGEKN